MFGLFNKNKRKWYSSFTLYPLSIYEKNIINNFFLKDNISYNQFIVNFKQYGEYDGVEFYTIVQPVIFDNIFSDSEKLSPSLAILSSLNPIEFNGVPQWFILAYPDVIVAAIKSNVLDHKGYFTNMNLYAKDSTQAKSLLRVLVDNYKSLGMRLEVKSF